MNVTPITRWGLNLLGLLGVVIALRLGESIFIPTVIAVLLAALVWPVVRWLNRGLRLPWSVACLTVVFGVVLLNLAITLGVGLAVPRMLQGLPRPNDPEGQKELYAGIRRQIEKITPVPLDSPYLPEDPENSRVYQYLQQSFEKGTYVTDALLKLVYYGNMWLWQWVLIMFILLFLLLEGRMLTRRIVEIVGPSKESQAQAVGALADMAHQVRNYLLWRTIVNIGLGLAVGLFYQFLGLKQPWTWGLLTAVLCYVPYLGPIMAGIPPLLDAFVNCPTPWYALALLAFYLAIITLEGYVIVPVVMGRSMEMNATTVMLSCLFWELVWGAPGLFLAMPLMAAIKAICWHMPGMRPWANLMGTAEGDGTPGTRLLPERAETNRLETEEELLSGKRDH